MRILLPALLTTSWAIAALLITSTPATAIPAFSREYRINCSTCHQITAPRLNPLGRNFQERGYQLPYGGERPAGTAKYSREDEGLALLERLPLALRIKNAGIYRLKDDPEKNRIDLNTPREIHLLAGGALFNNTSFFVNFPIFTNDEVGTPILAYLQFTDLFGTDVANLRVGKFNVLGLQFPGHRSLTSSPAGPAAVQVGRNPVVLDDHQVGIDLFGRPGNGLFSYEIALVNGAGPVADDHGEDEAVHAHGGAFSTDGNDFKDIYTRVTYSTRSRMHTVGALGYFGKSRLGADQDENNLVEAAPVMNDRFRILGLDGEFIRGAWNLRTALYAGHHNNPFGTGTSVNYQSAMAELSYSFSRRWLGMLHYDRVQSSDLVSLEKSIFTPHVSFLLLDNLRLSLELKANLDDADRNQAVFLIDATM